jgi:NAD(P)-dependent dehydrogenase (short-subunit alcohol dehydrogenase family)
LVISGVKKNAHPVEALSLVPPAAVACMRPAVLCFRLRYPASMAAAGARVIITGRRSGPLEDVRAEVGPAVIPVVHDGSDLPAIPAFLASTAAGFIHGITIPVDGGAAVGF